MSESTSNDAAGAALTNQPLYRIQAVAQRTGVSPMILRAWERRFGFPKPSRGDRRYRLFSEADVALIERMKSLLAAGVAPKEAARAVLEQAGKGDVPDAQSVARADGARWAAEEARGRAKQKLVDLFTLDRPLSENDVPLVEAIVDGLVDAAVHRIRAEAR